MTEHSQKKPTASSKKPAASSKKPKSAARKNASRRQAKNENQHTAGVMVMLLGLLLLLWFLVIYTQVIGMGKGFGVFCRNITAAAGNLILALVVVYAGYAIYTNRKARVGFWQTLGWCFVAFGILALLQVHAMEATFGASLQAALKGGGGGPLGFWCGALANLLPSEIVAAIVLWAFILLGLLLGTDFKVLHLFRVLPKAYRGFAGMACAMGERAKESTAKEPVVPVKGEAGGAKAKDRVNPIAADLPISPGFPIAGGFPASPEDDMSLAPLVIHYNDRKIPSELPPDLTSITFGEAQEISRARAGENSAFIRDNMPTVGGDDGEVTPYQKTPPSRKAAGSELGAAAADQPMIANPDIVYDPKGNNGLETDLTEDAAGDSSELPQTAAVKAAVKKLPPKPYLLPPVTLLKHAIPIEDGGRANSDIRDNSILLEQTLESFGVKTKVVQVVSGPAVTRYELQPAPGVRVAKIANLSDDIALALAAKGVRIEAPVPGKSVVGIEVPKTEVSAVMFREVVETEEFKRSKSLLSVALGLDIAGNPVVADLANMPHLLVAGATGSGKSVCINGLISSILFKAKPEEVKLIMVDPKKVELSSYAGLPHLARPVVTNPRKAAQVLKEMVSEMERRYTLFSTCSMKNFTQYNESNPPEKLPQIVIIIDELADLMMVAAKEVEDSICRLAQMARAAGIHMVVATQRPSVDVITGLIKANIPSRIAFAVSSYVDSRTIIDSGGAEKLLGRGDMLFLPVGLNKPLRVQGAFIGEDESESLVRWCSRQAEQEFIELPEVEDLSEENNGAEEMDELFHDAVQQVIASGQASASYLQRRFRIGYNRAARLVETMEQLGIIGASEGNKRPVRMTMEEFTMLYGHGK